MINKSNIKFAVKSNYYKQEEIDKGNRIIKAIVNTYNYFDSDADVLRMGCAKKSINERGAKTNAPNKILHAKDHDLTKLPGKSILEEETTVDNLQVLYAESRLSETLDGEELLIKYLDGIYNQHSIGFRYMNLDYVEKNTPEWDKFLNTIINPEDAEKNGFGWDVKEIMWMEWSTVAFGANKLTSYLGVKTQNKELQLQNVYNKLDVLINKAKRLDIKDKGLFEMQYKQLQQMISEISQPPINQVQKCTPGILQDGDKQKVLLNLI